MGGIRANKESEGSSNPLDKSLWKLTWPVFVDILCVFLINIVDTWFLSVISDESAAAVGAVLPFLGLGFTLFITLNYAGNAVAARLIGEAAGKGASGQAGELGPDISRCYGALLVLLLGLGCLVALL